MSDVLDREQQEGMARQSRRLPPGQSLTLKFPILHFGHVPKFDPATWDFKVWGAIEKPLRMTWDEINQLPKTELQMDIHCVTRWSKLDTLWKGVHIRTLIEKGLITLKTGAKFVIQHAEYGFSTNVPLEVALADNFLLATHYSGDPLTPDHGAPLRGIIGAMPGKPDLKTLYFWKGAKWLRGLEFSADDKPGFWEQAGYHNEGDVWREERRS